MTGRALSAQPNEVGDLTVEGLRVEQQTNPLEVVATRPLLSWRLASERRAQRQTCYQVQVASTTVKLLSGDADLWDSGSVPSCQQLGVEYAGQPLNTGQRCSWRVRVADRDGKLSAWSAPARWEMGLLSHADWKATWINDGSPPPESDEEQYHDDPAPLFRKPFQVAGKVRCARLRIAGLGYYEARLNGERVGDRVLDPGWTNYAKRAPYSTYDVTRQLEEGENVLAAMLGNGWYNPLPMRMWGRINLREHLRVGRPRLIAQLEIDYQDGSRQIVASDPSWRVAPGPIVRNNIYLGEHYDARREIPGWDRKGFDDSAWRQAAPAGEAVGALVPQQQPPVRVIGSLQPVAVTEPQPGKYVFDMGRNFTGWTRLRVSGPAGTTVQLKYGELLNPDGTVNTLTGVCGQIKQAGFGGPGAPAVAEQSDTYILRGARQETFTPTFTFHAFRYVEVTGLPEPPTRDAIQGLVLSADIESVGRFECSNPMLNRLQQVCRRTFRCNLISVQSDCPHRERFGYGGDIVATSDALMLNYDMARFYAKTVVDFADGARPSGGLTETAPYVGVSAGGFGERSGPIGWAITHPLLLAQLRQYYGEERLIDEQYATAARWLDLVASQSPDHLVSRGIGDHESLEPTSRRVTGTAFYYQAARLMSQLAEQQGRASDQEKYRALCESIQQAYAREFLDEATSQDRLNTQTALAATLFHGLAPKGVSQGLTERLAGAVNRRGDHIATGIFGAKYLLDTLPRRGHAELAYRVATQTDFPGWGHMLENDATTLWEHWRGSGSTFSHNHPMFGSVSEWMFRHLAGINVASHAVGADQIEFRPQVVGDLTHANARYDSVRGRVEAAWRLQGDELQVNLKVPVGAAATLFFPAQFSADLREGAAPIEEVAEITNVARSPSMVTFEIGSGEYVLRGARQ